MVALCSVLRASGSMNFLDSSSSVVACGADALGTYCTIDPRVERSSRLCSAVGGYPSVSCRTSVWAAAVWALAIMWKSLQGCSSADGWPPMTTAGETSAKSSLMPLELICSARHSVAEALFCTHTALFEKTFWRESTVGRRSAAEYLKTKKKSRTKRYVDVENSTDCNS